MCIKPLVFLLVLLSFSACRTSDLPANSGEIPFYVQKFLEEHTGDLFEFKVSPAKDKVLCIKKGVDRSSETVYAVYDLASKQQLFTSGVIGGEIEWLNNSEIKLTGTSRVDQHSAQAINVLTGETRVVQQSENDQK